MQKAKKRGYRNITTPGSAIFYRIYTKIGKPTGNAWCNKFSNFEQHRIKNVISRIFFIFFQQQNGRQFRHHESDLDEKQ